VAEAAMTDLKALWAARHDWLKSEGREQQIKDYVFLANQLVWKRQASFLSAALVSALYFNPFSSIAFYGIVLLTEFLDLMLGRQSRAWDGEDQQMGKRLLRSMVVNTAVSAIAISAFIVNMAVQEGGQFIALFFLFSASLFAAVYNSQIIGVLVLRLMIYGFAFFYVAFLDMFRFLPPITSQIWLEFFTTILVFHFILVTSLKYYSLYRVRLAQMQMIKDENERARAASEAKSQFLSTVSHELRTPLTSIKGSLDLIISGRLGELTPEVRPLLEMAGKNSRRLAHLIDDLLDLQKIEAGEMDFDFKPVNVTDMVNDAVESTSGYAAKLGVEVKTLQCPEDCWIMGDRTRLIQVMHNLLSNAMKFSEEGGVVEVRVEVADGHVHILVRDSGVGIPQDAEDHVFGAFKQVEAPAIGKVSGSGLGLNITRKIVERHNATIDYVSELGIGSTFCIGFQRLTDKDVARGSPHPVAQVA
jgi:signal transduction histidine kinase